MPKTILPPAFVSIGSLQSEYICFYVSVAQVQSLHISMKSTGGEYGTIIFSIKSMACLI